MSDFRLDINEKSITNELLRYKDQPYQALIEYVWNAFDAGANIVNINYNIPESGIGYIDKVEIIDNGQGWDFYTKDTKYFLSSSKSDVKKSNKTLPRGKWGRGRYVFIWFAQTLTAFSKNHRLALNKNLNGQITQDDTKNTNGTIIELSGLNELFCNMLTNIKKLEYELTLEFCWFLKENPNFSININQKSLDYSHLIKKSILMKKNDFSDELKFQLDDNISVEIILWDDRPHEFARFYFINPETTKEVFTSFTSLNKKKDEYWHSVYVRSTLFDLADVIVLEDENQHSLFRDEATKIKTKLIKEIKQKLILLRKPVLLDKSKTVISSLHAEKVIPKLDNFGILDSDSFDDLLEQVFIIAPFLFIGKGKEDKKFLCSVLAGLLSSYDPNLIGTILQHVQALSPEEQRDLDEILRRTTLANIVRTIKEIDYRMNVIEDLNKLVFDLKKYTLEVADLQKVLNTNTWIFGEEFRLFKDTEGSLRNTLTEYAERILKIENPNIETSSRKELDLFLVKSLEERETVHRNIIIEIKRPQIKLGKNEFDQLEEYALTIMKEPSCNGTTMWWEFYLIGDDYNDYIESKIEAINNRGESSKGLISWNKDGRFKIYVRKWSDILHTEWGYKMKYLKENLQMKSNEIKTDKPSEISEKYKSDIN